MNLWPERQIILESLNRLRRSLRSDARKADDPHQLLDAVYAFIDGVPVIDESDLMMWFFEYLAHREKVYGGSDNLFLAMSIQGYRDAVAREQKPEEIAGAALVVASAVFDSEHKADSHKSKTRTRRLRKQASGAARAKHEKRAEQTTEPLKEMLEKAAGLKRDGVVRKAAAGKLHAEYGEHWSEERIYRLIGDAPGGRWPRGESEQRC